MTLLRYADVYFRFCSVVSYSLSVPRVLRIRFLKASSLNGSKAAEKWERYMDWWKENDGSNIRNVSATMTSWKYDLCHVCKSKSFMVV